MLLTSLVHIFPPPSLPLDSWSSAWYLVVGLCIRYLQSLDEGSSFCVAVEDHDEAILREREMNHTRENSGNLNRQL